jgi:hypothetical protein
MMTTQATGRGRTPSRMPLACDPIGEPAAGEAAGDDREASAQAERPDTTSAEA